MASIKDVAKHANVGIATVSRVINDSGFVSKETRELVLKSIKELGYVPNEVARNFKRKQTNLIGLIVPNLTQGFTAELTHYLEKELYNLGYHTMLCTSNHNGAKEIEYLEKLKSHQVAGAIITAPFLSEDESLEYQDLPLVFVDRYVNDSMPCIHVDHYQATIELMDYLTQFNRHQYAYIGFGADKLSLTHKRKEAFVDYVQERSLSYQLIEMYYEETIQDYIKRVYALTQDTDALFFSCDYHAHLYINYAVLQGRLFNRDYSIVAFDGLASNRHHPYDLTCIVQPIETMSKAVVQALMKRINHSHEERDVVIEHVLNSGNSC